MKIFPRFSSLTRPQQLKPNRCGFCTQNSCFSWLINTQKYDLSSTLLVEKTRQQLFEHQTCVFGGFLTYESISFMRDFAIQARKALPHPGTTYSTIFYQEPDDKYDKTHPLNRQVTRSNTYITAKEIPVDFPLRKLQDSQYFRNFLIAVTGESLLEYNCEVSKFVFSLSRDGDHQNWHFDNNFLTLTFMLQQPEEGGLLVVYPEIGRENYSAISAVLDGREPEPALPKTYYEYKVGDMILFNGRHSLHQSTTVKGQTERIIAIISYNTVGSTDLPNAKHMEKVYNLKQ